MNVLPLCTVEISSIGKREELYLDLRVQLVLGNCMPRALGFRGLLWSSRHSCDYSEEEPDSVNLSSKDKPYLQSLAWQCSVFSVQW